MKSKNLYSTKCLNPIYLKAAFSMLLIGFMHLSNAQTPVYGEMLEPSESNCSSLFKLNVGNNRDTVYNHLEKLIAPLLAEPSFSTILTNAIGANTTNKEQILYMLGEPDRKIESAIYEYNLKASPSNCMAVIGFNGNGEVTFKLKKNCP